MITTADKIAAITAYKGFLARPGRTQRDPRLFAIRSIELSPFGLIAQGYWIDDDQRTRTIAITADELDTLYREALRNVADAKRVVATEGLRGRMLG